MVISLFVLLYIIRTRCYKISIPLQTLIDDNTKEYRTVEGKYVPDTWVKRKPARRFLQLSSAPLSVPHDVDSWFVAKVI